MRRKKIPKKYLGKWVLLKDGKVIFSSVDVGKVVEKGWEYPENEVMIEKAVAPGMCFY